MSHQPGTSSAWRLTPARLLWGLLVLVALIMLMQNTTQVTLQFLVWEISAPLFVIIGAALLIGLGLGEVGTRAWRWRHRRTAD